MSTATPLSPSLERLRAEVAAALPNVTVHPVAYDIGYWCRRARVSVPKSVTQDSEIEQFGAGWQCADAEIREENGS